MDIALAGVYSSYHVIGNSDILYDFFKAILQYDSNELLLNLFKKTVKKDKLAETLALLELVLNRLTGNKKALLEKIIRAFKYQVELSYLYCQKGKIYDPIRFIIFDEPYCTLSDNIPLEDYDNNDGEPFWMRPKYILDHYSKSNRTL